VGLSTRAIFSVFAGYFFENFRDGQRYKQSVVSFSVIPKRIPRMTLNGYFALNSVFATVWLAPTARLSKIIACKLIKIDTYCQRLKSSTGTQVSGNIRFVRIFGRVL